MDFLSSTSNQFYGWLSTLIRRAGRRKTAENTSPTAATENQSFEDSSSESTETGQNNCEQLIPTLTFISKNAEERERTPPPIAPRRNLPSSSNNQIDKTDKISKNNLNDLTKSNSNPESNSNNSSEMDSSRRSTSGDNSIEEDIEEAIATPTSSISSEKQSEPKIEKLFDKRRSLFDIDDDDDNFDDFDDSHFVIDESELSGQGLAKHFFKLDVSPDENDKTKKKEAMAVSEKNLLKVPAKTKSIEEASESMPMKMLLEGNKIIEETLSNLSEKDKPVTQKVKSPSHKGILRRTRSTNKSSEGNSQSNSSNQSEAELISEIQSVERHSKQQSVSVKEPSSSRVSSKQDEVNKSDGAGGALNESLTNQSTTNDVSEIFEEISDDINAQSLNLSSKFDNLTSKSKENSSGIQEFPLDNIKLDISSQSDTLINNAQNSTKTSTNLKDKSNNNLVFDDSNLSDPSFDVHDISRVNKILNETSLENANLEETAKNSISTVASSSQEDDMDALKDKILSIKLTPKSGPSGPHMARDVSYEQVEDQQIAIKQMEKVQIDFHKDILEDITEESEKVSSSGLQQVNQFNDYDNNTSNDFDSIVSLNMIQMLENKIKDLQDVVTAKDVCLNALNMQIDASQRRESYATIESFRESLEKLPPSGRDSSSIATNSTEYRGLQEELTNKIFDFHSEIAQRDQLIEKLTDSLQQSIQIRENHQSQIDKLNIELETVRKQLTEMNRKQSLPLWINRPDQESNGQRLSEISIDLVSESNDDYDSHCPTDNEEAVSRHSRERQLSVDYGQMSGSENFEQQPGSQMSISKQIEQFQKYLNPDELRIFFMVQKKFDDFLSQEVAKVKGKYDNELKILADQMESEKRERDNEINRLKQLLINVKNGSTELIQLRQELDELHAKEMEDLRTYFEKKCAELEKQYSEEIFSQQSQRNDIQSDISDQENLPDDETSRRDSLRSKTKEGTPRKRTREELYSSPSHRQMTPTEISPERTQRRLSLIEAKIKNDDKDLAVEELKRFYQSKIEDINNKNDKIIKSLNEKLKRFESKYADDEFMSKSDQVVDASSTLKQKAVVQAYAQEDQMSSYIIIDEDEMTSESNEIAKIAAEYERRLVEQVQLAKEDIIRELENQIQALLSETTAEDQHWPPELILLREKFTAKSQLEIAQLQIKHEEEMARLKVQYEKQLNRKIKRQSTFDLSRDLDQIINERDGLRDLSLAFRHVTSELAKCVSLCEDDLNVTFLEELQRLSGQQDNQNLTQKDQTNITNAGDILDNSLINESVLKKSILETTLQKRLAPDVSSLLNVVDDPNLMSYISAPPPTSVTSSPKTTLNNENFNLKDCIEKLKNEAQMLLELSENICQRKHMHIVEEFDDNDEEEKQDACAEDGLRSKKSPRKVLRANSMNESFLYYENEKQSSHHLTHLSSLPTDLSKVINEMNMEECSSTGGPASELNFQVNELRNRLVKAEGDKYKLQLELEATIRRNSELGIELAGLRDQIDHLDSNREDYVEGYSIGDIKSPQRVRNVKNSSSFSQLQEKARNILGTPRKSADGDTLLQLIEDFCREGDKVMENSRKENDDLQAQIDAADKQLKATRLFLEDQAAEREIERDEFVKEIEKLNNLLRDKDKERTSLQNVSNEKNQKQFVKISTNSGSAERMEHQIKELSTQIAEYDSKKDKLEIELKASIDKIFVLREIISDLETQVETKALNEHVLNEKVKELQSYTNEQSNSIEMLQHENEILKNEIGQGYQKRITHLEDALRNTRPLNEQSTMLGQFGEQLRDIATTLEEKTKILESLHQSVASVSYSDTPREDVSLQDRRKSSSVERAQHSRESSKGSPVISTMTVSSPRLPSLPVEEIELVFEKLAKHTRVEEAAIKRIKDLEMHMTITRTAYGELQQERDVLQEKMSEQMVRISTLQNKLDEQKRRAEELHRNDATDLNIKIHDLQNDLQNLTETLSARDKQIVNLKNHLEQSKKLIDRQEAELAMGINSDRSIVDRLENELKQKIDENKKLRDKIKSEMINKLALPDLMETMLADKNEEIDQLREQLEAKDKELKNLLELNSINNSSKDKDRTNSDNGAGEAKLSARTLSDIVSISEYDEPDIIRKAIPQQNASPLLLHQPSDPPDQTMNTSKLAMANLTEKRTDDLTIFNSLPQPPTFNHPNFFATDPSIPSNLSSVPSFGPRHINFSEFIDESKFKESTPKQKLDSIDGAGGGGGTGTGTSNLGDDQKNLKSKLNAANDEISKLKISLENVSKENKENIEKLQKQLENKEKQVQELNSEKVNLTNKIAEYNPKLEKATALEKQLKDKEENYNKLENEFIQLQLKLGECEDSLDEKLRDIEKLHKEITKLTETKNKKSIEEIEILNEKIRKLSDDNNSLQSKLDELNALNFAETIALLNNQVEILTETVEDKDEILKKYEVRFLDFEEKLKISEEKAKELQNKLSELSTQNNKLIEFEKLSQELNVTRSNLFEKSVLYERCQLDIESFKLEIGKLKESLIEKDACIAKLNANTEKEKLTEIQEKLINERARNLDLQKRLSGLEIEVEKIKSQQSSESSHKQLSLDEIARQVEKELNYSAQLDSNILKAIESEEENNELLPYNNEQNKLTGIDFYSQMKTIKEELEKYKNNSNQIQKQLEEEKKNSKLLKDELNKLKLHADTVSLELNKEKAQAAEIQQQDCDIIDTMRARLEEALRKEQELNKLIDEEREKCNRLSTQLAALQHSEIKKANYYQRSPPESPRKLSSSPDFENSLVRRLKSEIELLTSQNKRERERMADLQKLFENEKSRFESELKENIEYGESLKSKVERLAKDKDNAEQEIDHLQEHNMLQAQEIESLTKRIVSLQEAETRRLQRREKERSESTQNLVDLQDLKAKLHAMELERDHFNQTINLLRNDIERSAKREAKLAEALASQSPDATIPQQFLTKMKEMNTLLRENMKDLMDERKALQRKCDELENHIANSGPNTNSNSNNDMAERTNQLLGRLLRVESHRKALVHQKRYLMISLQSYQDTETRTLALINGTDCISQPKRNLFKSAALVVVAIERMKYIARRWQNGKRIVSKSIFTITQQKRAPVTTTTNFYNSAPISISPPCRDTNATNNAINLHSPPFQLQTPNLITEYVANQQHLNHLQHQQHQQPQKFDWSRLKKQ